jgi:pyrimidine-nucleoside phosphorylase/thymidine phosphorylase
VSSWDPRDVVAAKRDGRPLGSGELARFVQAYATGEVGDSLAAAFLMAAFIHGLDAEETLALTHAMVDSGQTLPLAGISRPKVDKHSTGGVADGVTLVFAPLAASLGLAVAKLSGRGLGHTGGTLDKLESIPGYRINLTIDEFKRVLRDVGTSIIGQSASLAPADKKLYALRDVTATVESIPLIAASIMSKKLAEGSNALVLDVKCGDGAFMKRVQDAQALAETMVSIGGHAGVRTEAFLTDMDSPLGSTIGNALEIVECIDALKGAGTADLTAVVIRLSSRMLMLGGVESDAAAATGRVAQALASGRALQTFARMIEAQGGDPRVVDDPSLLPTAPGRARFEASRPGFVDRMKAEALGRASNMLGAGRSAVGDPVDHAVGIVMRVKPGDRVERGQLLLELHHRDGRGLEAALALCADAISIGDQAPVPRAKLLGEVR